MFDIQIIMEKYYKKILSHDPLIFTIDNFLTNDECKHFINISKPDFSKALITAENSSVFINEIRNGYSNWVYHNTDEVTKNVSNRISQLVNMSLHNAEPFQVIYYEKYQFFNQHFDGWKLDDSIRSKRCLLQGGQRMITTLCYLNDVLTGGQTYFPLLNLYIKPKKGQLLCFYNTHKNTNIINEKTLHAGLAVMEGEKYAFNLWFREYPLNQRFLWNNDKNEYELEDLITL